MNAQECRTLTATCMHIAWLTVYTTVHVQYSISGVLTYIHLNKVLVLLTTYPAPKQGSGTRVSA